MMTPKDHKARREERRAQREMLRAQRQREGGSLRGARRASDRDDYAERRARALEAARAQPQIESIEEPPAEPPPEEPLPDQMEAEVPLEPEEVQPEEPST